MFAHQKNNTAKSIVFFCKFHQFSAEKIVYERFIMGNVLILRILRDL